VVVLALGAAGFAVASLSRARARRLLREADLVTNVLLRGEGALADRRVMRLVAAYRAEKARARNRGNAPEVREAARAIVLEFRKRRRDHRATSLPPSRGRPADSGDSGGAASSGSRPRRSRRSLFPFLRRS